MLSFPLAHRGIHSDYTADPALVRHTFSQHRQLSVCVCRQQRWHSSRHQLALTSDSKLSHMESEMIPKPPDDGVIELLVAQV
jgi:hypothetical protein